MNLHLTNSRGAGRCVALALLAVLPIAPAAKASKAVIGTLGTPSGEGNGQLHYPIGVAVNHTGAGGVEAGDVYVVDSGKPNAVEHVNNRVIEFSSSGAFIRAFGYDVVQSGEDNTGVNEKRTVTVDATGGSFTVGTVNRSFATFTEGSNVVTNIVAATSAFHVGDVIEGVVPAGTTITGVGTESLILSAGATATVSGGAFSATETTAGMSYNTTAGVLSGALEGLPAIGLGNIAVTGGPGASNPFTVEFKGALGNNEIPTTLEAGSAALTGATHTVTVATSLQGGGSEVCNATSIPADICKAGSESQGTAAGAMNRPTGIAIDETNGNVYVADVTNNTFFSNNRVDVYSATGAFEGAFGWDVNKSNPKHELQFCTAATGCQQGSSGSGPGQLNSGFSFPSFGPNGHLYVPDANSNAHRIEEFIPVSNGSGEVTGVTFVGALGWDVVASGPDQTNEIQRVLVRAGAGKFKLTFKSSTTGELPFDAPASEAEETAGGPESVEKALNALPTINSTGGSVSVVGGPGDASGAAPYSVTFDGGPLDKTDVAEMTATKVGMSGGNPSTVLSVETYSNGTEGLEYCVVSRGDVCKAGGKGPHVGGGDPKLRVGEFSEETPRSVVVDQSGALYAVNSSVNFGANGPARVYKFTFPGPGEVVANEFAPEFLTQDSGIPGAVEPFVVTVDPMTQHVLVSKRESFEAEKFYEFDSSGVLLDRSPGGESGLKAGEGGALATGVSGRFYFTNSELGLVDVFGLPPAPVVSVSAATGVGASSATLHGTVTPPALVEGRGFDTTYHFEYSLEGTEVWSSFPVEDVDVGDGSGSGPPDTCPVNSPPVCTVERTVTGLVPSSHYLVRLVASTGTVAVSGNESFATEPGPPLVSGTDVEDLGETSVKLTGFVNPTNDAATYRFEWGTDTGYGNRAPVADGSAGSGGAPAKVTDTLEGLKSGTVYHFRLVATNSSGTATGPDREFSTLDRYGLPDGRAAEQVTPNDKRPVGTVDQGLERNIDFQASDDGSSIIYPLLNGAADATAGGNVDYLGRRGGSGWLSNQLTPPTLVPEVNIGVGNDATGQVLYAPPDLSCEIVESLEPLTADTSPADVAEGIKNLYRRSADGSYTLLSAPVPLNQGGGIFKVDWTSADCAHILFETADRLLEEAPANGPAPYEWVEGTLRLAGVVPNESAPSGESVAGEAFAGLGNHNSGGSVTARNSMSKDGSKVFFTAPSLAGADKGHQAVFVRSDGTSTVDASQSQTATVDLGAVYVTATADGSHVFFLANYGLATNGSSSGVGTCDGGIGCDLYDYAIATKTMTDISVDANAADIKGASVVSLFDVADDGSYIYFAARGQLVSGRGKTEAQNLEGSHTFNVYASHAGVLSYVGLIAEADTDIGGADSGSDGSLIPAHWVADATPDGKHLLFVSKANVTGYDSKDVTEAYVYSATSGETTCVSCRPDGLPSLGDGNTEPITVNPPYVNSGIPSNEVQHRVRSISDDGRRVVFTMPDVLAPGANAHTHNVYEWEAGRVYLLAAGEESAKDFTRFADMSSTGDDVFVVTKAKLVAQDFEKTTDVYDLRVGGGFPEPGPGAPPCDALADQCQGEAAAPLVEVLRPPSGFFSGPGNVAPREVVCGKGLVSVGGKCVGKKPAVKHKPVPKHCKKGHVRRRGKCVKKASVTRSQTTTNQGRIGR